jgi:hypothetical protein
MTKTPPTTTDRPGERVKPQDLPIKPSPPDQDLATVENRLHEGLEESFPASDPLSVDPAKPKKIQP